MTPAICLALALFFEARSEPVEAQLAIAEVIINRAEDSRWPDTICGVVRQGEERRHKCQFSFMCDGKPERPDDNVIEQRAWDHAHELADQILSDPSILAGMPSDHYVRTDVQRVWMNDLFYVDTIGSHTFLTSKE